MPAPRPPRPSTIARVATLTVAFAVLLLAGCAKDPVAGLAELPSDSAQTLQPIPGTRVLGSTVQPAALEPPPPIPAGQRCAANSSLTFYEAQITTPIVVCFSVFDVELLENGLFYSRNTPTKFKLTDAAVGVNLKDQKLWKPPFACHTSNGPWTARITASRGCVGTCSPQNTLIVVGVPNNVSYGWYGALEDHPAGFEFVSTPTVTSKTDLGPCNPPPSPPDL